MSDAKETVEITKRPRPNYLPLVAVIAIAAFLAGLIPSWLNAKTSRQELQAAKGRASLDQIKISLGAAAIQARRGDYEIARQETSRFFTSLLDETNRGTRSALSPAQRERVAPLFAQRDELITLLARGDPASAERLSDLYVAYAKAVQG